MQNLCFYIYNFEFSINWTEATNEGGGGGGVYNKITDERASQWSIKQAIERLEQFEQLLEDKSNNVQSNCIDLIELRKFEFALQLLNWFDFTELPWFNWSALI